jgi:hypothetical protein
MVKHYFSRDTISSVTAEVEVIRLIGGYITAHALGNLIENTIDRVHVQVSRI